MGGQGKGWVWESGPTGADVSAYTSREGPQLAMGGEDVIALTESRGPERETEKSDDRIQAGPPTHEVSHTPLLVGYSSVMSGEPIPPQPSVGASHRDYNATGGCFLPKPVACSKACASCNTAKSSL